MKKQELRSIPEWYKGYVDAVPDVPLIAALKHADEAFCELIADIAEENASFSYEADKWSIKDLILHLSDAERIFSYRALRLARKDGTVLSGYDHNDYVEKAMADQRSKEDLLMEYRAVRSSTIALYSTLSEESLIFEGKVDDNVFTAGMLGFIIAGHQLHHISIIKTRYIPKLEE